MGVIILCGTAVFLIIFVSTNAKEFYYKFKARKNLPHELFNVLLYWQEGDIIKCTPLDVDSSYVMYSTEKYYLRKKKWKLHSISIDYKLNLIDDRSKDILRLDLVAVLVNGIVENMSYKKRKLRYDKLEVLDEINNGTGYEDLLKQTQIELNKQIEREL